MAAVGLALSGMAMHATSNGATTNGATTNADSQMHHDSHLGRGIISQHCTQMTNYADSQFTVGISIGTPSQTLQAIPDTGSFELLVASEACTDACGGGNHTLFNSAASTSFLYGTTKTGVKGEYTAYGQGEVMSVLVSDRVELGGKCDALSPGHFPCCAHCFP